MMQNALGIDHELYNLQKDLNRLTYKLSKPTDKKHLVQIIYNSLAESKLIHPPSYHEIFLMEPLYSPRVTHLQEFFAINEILTSFVIDLIEKPIKNHLATGKVLASIIKTVIDLKDIAKVSKSLPAVIGMIAIAVSAVLMLFPVIYVRRSETNLILRLLNITSSILNIARVGLNSSTFYTIRVGLQLIKGLLKFMLNTIDSWILQNVFAVIIAFTLLPVATIALYYIGVVFILIGGAKNKVDDFLRNADIFASAVRRYVLALGIAAASALGVAWFAKQSTFLRNLLQHVENGFKEFINELKQKATQQEQSQQAEQQTGGQQNSPTQALTSEADYLQEVDLKQIIQGVIGGAIISFIFKLLKKFKIAAILGFLVIFALKYEKFRNWVERIPIARRIIQMLVNAYKQFVKSIGLDKILAIGEEQTKEALSGT